MSSLFNWSTTSQPPGNSTDKHPTQVKSAKAPDKQTSQPPGDGTDKLDSRHITVEVSVDHPRVETGGGDKMLANIQNNQNAQT